MRVSEVLRRKGGSVSKITTVEKVATAIARLAEQRIGVLVVEDRWGHLAGMLSERDILHALARHAAEALQCEVHELMTPEVTTCTPEDRIDAVMEVMTAHRIRHLPVMENDRLVGLVSIGDLVKAKLLEKEQEANVLRDMTLTHI